MSDASSALPELASVPGHDVTTVPAEEASHRRLRHFAHLGEAERRRIFHREPSPFGIGDQARLLAVALGATLYAPATRSSLVRDLRRCRAHGVTSMVICLEDAVADPDVSFAEGHVCEQLRAHASARLGIEAPLIFVRVREPEQIDRLVTGLGPAADVLAGFVLPKFTAETGPRYLAALSGARERSGVPYWAMPVLESPEIAFRETRESALAGIRDLLDRHRSLILAVRLGATDLCGLFGVRRTPELTIYDVHVVGSVIADVVNLLGRRDGTGYPVSGPVWEYFGGEERIFKPLLRESPFARHHEVDLRERLVANDLDGLIREVVLDRANGLVGKTVIHPSHVAAVHALSTVSHEEYCDAQDILASLSGGGVARSVYRNKMNEGKPHRAWAKDILLRAEVFGVTRPEISFVDLLSASTARAAALRSGAVVEGAP